MVATEVTNFKTTGSPYDPVHMGNCTGLHNTVGAFLRIGTGSYLSQITGRYVVPRNMATRLGRCPIFSVGQFNSLLYPANAIDHTLLCADLGESVETIDTGRLKRRPNGSHATEIENKSC